MSIRAYKTIKKYSKDNISKKILLNKEVFTFNDTEILEVFQKYGVMYTNEDNLGEMEISRENIEYVLNKNISNNTKLILNEMLNDLNKTNEEWFLVTTL